MEIRLTAHALDQLEERGITRDEVAAALAKPGWRDEDPWIHRVYRVIEDRGICVLTSKQIMEFHLVVTIYDRPTR